jgi:hypothetical protein
MMKERHVPARSAFSIYEGQGQPGDGQAMVSFIPIRDRALLTPGSAARRLV